MLLYVLIIKRLKRTTNLSYEQVVSLQPEPDTSQALLFVSVFCVHTTSLAASFSFSLRLIDSSRQRSALVPLVVADIYRNINLLFKCAAAEQPEAEGCRYEEMECGLKDKDSVALRLILTVESQGFASREEEEKTQ